MTNKLNIYLLSLGGTIASLSENSTDEFYSPNKARVLLMLALIKINDISQLRELF